jgi:hypothetical protein
MRIITLKEKPDSIDRMPEPGETYIFLDPPEIGFRVTRCTRRMKREGWTATPQQMFIIDESERIKQ